MNQEKELIELGKKVATLEGGVQNLEKWQKSQNGTIKQVDKKVDGLVRWMMAIMGGIIASIFVNVVKG